MMDERERERERKSNICGKRQWKFHGRAGNQKQYKMSLSPRQENEKYQLFLQQQKNCGLKLPRESYGSSRLMQMTGRWQYDWIIVICLMLNQVY